MREAAEKALRDAGFVCDAFGIWDKEGFSDGIAPLYNACWNDIDGAWEMRVPSEELVKLLRPSLSEEGKKALKDELCAIYERAQEVVTIGSDGDCRHELANVYIIAKELHSRL